MNLTYVSLLKQERELYRLPRDYNRFLTYTRVVIEPFLDATDMRTAIECLYGDAAGRTLAFTPRGLSDRAGLALALHDALELAV